MQVTIKDYFKAMGEKGGKALANKVLEKDPDYFKRLSKKAVEAKRLKRGVDNIIPANEIEGLDVPSRSV